MAIRLRRATASPAISSRSGISTISTIPTCWPASTRPIQVLAISMNRSARCGITTTVSCLRRKTLTRACSVFYLLFNDHDTGNEETGFHLPSYPDFDIPLAFADKVYDSSGQLFFDLFSLDGILGDKFLVNGKVQPFFPGQAPPVPVSSAGHGPLAFL